MKTNLHLIVCCALSLAVHAAHAQTPVRLWASFFNGNLTGRDEARSVIADADGNVLVTGTSYHFFNGGNFSTIKYDSSGNQLWADHYYSAQQGYFNGGKKLVQDKWGNFYAVGTLAINDGDLAIIKYGPNGRLWTINYQPYYFSTYDDFGVDMGLDSSGNFYAIAQVMSPSGNMDDLYIMKCDSSGTKIWDENYSGGSGPDYPRGLAVSASGNAYAAMSTFNFFGSATYDIATRKYTPSGGPDWTSNYNGAGNATDYPVMIDIDAGENTYVCGAGDAGATDDMVCYKQNIYGTRLWTVTYNGTASLNDTAVAIRRLPNNLAVVTGSTKELVNGITRNAIVTMLIDSGTVLWTKKYFGADSLGATPTGMVIDAIGNILICGFEETPLVFKNGIVLCYDASGNIVWGDSYDSGAGLNDRFNAITTDAFGNIFVTGQSFSSGISNANYVTVKYGYGSPQAIIEYAAEATSVFPNPVMRGQYVTITTGKINDATTLSVFSVDGRKITCEYSVEGNYIHVNTKNLSAGIYTLLTGTGKPVKLMVQ